MVAPDERSSIVPPLPALFAVLEACAIEDVEDVEEVAEDASKGGGAASGVFEGLFEAVTVVSAMTTVEEVATALDGLELSIEVGDGEAELDVELEDRS